MNFDRALRICRTSRGCFGQYPARRPSVFISYDLGEPQCCQQMAYPRQGPANTSRDFILCHYVNNGEGQKGEFNVSESFLPDVC